MKILSFTMITLFSFLAYAQDQGFCDIKANNDVIDAVEQEVFQVLSANGIEIEEGATWDVIVKTPTVYNQSSFGDALDIMKTDLLVYEMQDWVLEKGLLKDRTLVFQVRYNSIFSEQGDKSFTCIESGKKSDQIITSVDEIKKL